MMNWLIKGLGRSLGPYIVGGVAALLLVLPPATYALGHHNGWKAHEAKVAADTAQAVKRDADAKETASLERQQDLSTVSQHQQELNRADDKVDDSVPSAARRALFCARLRQQSGERAAVSAGCGPTG
jgi:hypothetical protein